MFSIKKKAGSLDGSPIAFAILEETYNQEWSFISRYERQLDDQISSPKKGWNLMKFHQWISLKNWGGKSRNFKWKFTMKIPMKFHDKVSLQPWLCKTWKKTFKNIYHLESFMEYLPESFTICFKCGGKKHTTVGHVGTSTWPFSKQS